MIINNNFQLNLETIKRNKNEISNVIRVLIAKFNISLLEKYKDKADEFFLNPLLIAFFNNPEHNKNTLILEEILSQKYNKTPIADHQELIVLNEIPNYIKHYFFEMYRGEMINEKPDFSIRIDKIKQVKTSLDVIKKYIPDYYREFNVSNKMIIFHDNPQIINFVTKSFNGFLSFWVTDEVSEIYFIEEFIHQGAHNYLNLVFHHHANYFKTNPENVLMSTVTGNKKDYRSLMSAIHGLYTITQRMKYFKTLLLADIYTGELKHELLGRYTDQLTRFKGLGVYHKNIFEYLTDEGIMFFNQMKAFGSNLIAKDEILLSHFDTSWRDIDFYYSKFQKANSYTKFKTNIEAKLNLN